MATKTRQTKTTQAQEVELGIEIGGEHYNIADLTLTDVVELEEEFGENIEDLDIARKKVVLWIIWLLRRKKEPALTLEDVGNELTLGRLMMYSPDSASDPLEESEEPESGK